MAESVKTPSPRRKVLLGGAIALLVLAGAAVAAFVLGGGADRRSDGASGDLVKIEIRAPGATLRFRGKDLGRAPVTLQLPRGKEPQTVEATFTEHKLNIATRKPVNVKKTASKTFVPDDHQSVDIHPDDAK